MSEETTWECKGCGGSDAGINPICRQCGRGNMLDSPADLKPIFSSCEFKKTREDRVFEMAGCLIRSSESPIAAIDLLDTAKASILLVDEIYARLRDEKKNNVSGIIK